MPESGNSRYKELDIGVLPVTRNMELGTPVIEPFGPSICHEAAPSQRSAQNKPHSVMTLIISTDKKDVMVAAEYGPNQNRFTVQLHR